MFDLIIDLMEGLFGPIIDSFKKLKKYKKPLKVLVSVLLLISVCFYISIKSNHIFGRILSIGVGSNLFIYVIMNISMVSGLMPVVGIPLPLVSYGGSAMLAIIISLGLVLNVELNGNLKKLYNA